MPEKVLWFDDDPFIVTENMKGKPEHLEIKVVSSLTEATESIINCRYDLLILDVMIPTKSAQEEGDYPPSATDRGRKTGLEFYERWRKKLDADGTKVFVFTILRTADIRKEFINAGLSEDHYATKFSLRRPADFWARICRILGN